ncbi:MAG: hypothetical protein Q8W51_00560 [Candidatus Palauibacterales bacterium]|nr:hypothetical protein [Candidatus Palauibacterales bacterium]MDP2528209.1 hypothetical protein [Candidatus Palauibacterales bacterium]MDP2584869.1 hypothetical protein [Candidatus Palauibacterales bacterium]
MIGSIDPVILLGMGFVLVVLLLVGGFLLVYPLSRRLSAVLEESIRLRRSPGTEPASPAILDMVRDTRRLVEGLGDRLDAIEERQRFVENLLESPRGSGRDPQA